MLRKKDPLLAAYGDTPAATLAVLAAGAVARCDGPEFNRISESMTDKGRSRASRVEFVLRSHALTEATLLWALDCWQTYAKISETTAIIASPEADTRPPTGAILMNRAMNAKLASLIEAQKAICKRNGQNFSDIAGLAGISGMHARDEGATQIPKLVEELVAQYSIA